jgi:hypothetical protein
MKVMMKLVCICGLLFTMGLQAEVSKNKCEQLKGEWKSGKCTVIEKDSCKTVPSAKFGYFDTVKKSCVSISESGVKSQGTDCTSISNNSHEATQARAAGNSGQSDKNIAQ